MGWLDPEGAAETGTEVARRFTERTSGLWLPEGAGSQWLPKSPRSERTSGSLRLCESEGAGSASFKCTTGRLVLTEGTGKTWLPESPNCCLLGWLDPEGDRTGTEVARRFTERTTGGLWRDTWRGTTHPIADLIRNGTCNVVKCSLAAYVGGVEVWIALHEYIKLLQADQFFRSAVDHRGHSDDYRSAARVVGRAEVRVRSQALGQGFTRTTF